MFFFGVTFAILGAYSQTTYYVASKGTDSSTCGPQNDPCFTINQVLTNYPGTSFYLSIGTGAYTPTAITLQRDAVVIFQGTRNPPPTIIPSWRSGLFIANTATSGFEFRDVSITLSGSGDAFTSLDAVGNVVGFYNVNLTYSDYASGNFVGLDGGGSLVISNVTFKDAYYDGQFIRDDANKDNKITVTGCTFTNLTFGDGGGFLSFGAHGVASVAINGSTFFGISGNYVFIGIWFADLNQLVSITNSVFNNIHTYYPVYVENAYLSVTYVDNTTWNNALSNFVSGALEILGSDNGNDLNITLSNLKFDNCSGPYVGAVLVGYNSLNITNSSFSAGHGQYGSDVVQYLDYITVGFGFDVSNCYSSSPLPKAVVWDTTTSAVVDISDQFPDPVGTVPFVRLNGEKVSGTLGLRFSPRRSRKKGKSRG